MPTTSTLSEPRCPGLAKAGIAPHRSAIRKALLDWMEATRTSLRDLQLAVRSTDKTGVENVTKGLRPMPAEWISLIMEDSPRHGRDLQKRIDYAIEGLSRERQSA